MDRTILDALDAIDCSRCSHAEWVQIGMALKQEGFGVDVWDAWSARDTARYHPGECEKRWNSFRGSSQPVSGGTIIKMARDMGWDDRGEGWGWDVTIEADSDPHDGWIIYQGDSDTGEPGMTPVEQLAAYLRAVFAPEDIVGYVVNDARQNDDGKWVPSGRGTYTRTAGELLDSLAKHQDDIAWTVGDPQGNAGGWIRFNPLDGKGVGNENVTAYRFALVESDGMPVNEQIEAYRRHQLPVAAMVMSGGKSVHAIVHIDAANLREYRERVDYLYRWLDKNDVKVDPQNRNPSRLSRMPGVMRGKQMQKLICVNTGKANWLDWVDYAEGLEDDLPKLITLKEAFASPIVLPEPLIDGLLRRGHKMLISGSSKAGKSFLLMELCTAIVSGGEWLGFKCHKGRVLYVNLEIDSASCLNRFANIWTALGIDHGIAESGDLIVWNLRGCAMQLDDLVPKLIRRVRGLALDAIVVDPLYKVLTGDENSASDMAYFCNQFDRIATATNCAVIYCHHHSKGMQGSKRAIDRASGSGVFARDPDAQLDMIELELSDELKNFVADRGDTAWRLESSLREFRNIKPVNFWFRWPLHVVDTSGELEAMAAQGSVEAAAHKSAVVRGAAAMNKYVEAFRAAAMGNPDAMLTAKEIASQLVDKPTEDDCRSVNKWMSEGGASYFETIKRGKKNYYRMRDELGDDDE